LVPLSLVDPVATETLRGVVRRCYDPNTVSNPTAIVTEGAVRFARTRSRKGDELWLAFRSFPMNLYMSIVGKRENVRQWFRFAVDNAGGELWSKA